MSRKVALCADSESLRHPQLIGLDDVSLEAADWLMLFSDAAEARVFLSADSSVDEVWVVSCDGMDAINLAACIKRDSPEKKVFLVSSEFTGSSMSKSHAAGLTGALSIEGFARRFNHERRCNSVALEGSGLAGACALESMILDDINEEDFLASSKSSSVVLSVVGAGGGVGKSSFAAIVSSAMARRGYKAVLVDGDLVGGDVASMSGVESPLRLDEFLAPGFRESSCVAIKNCASGYAVVAAPEKIEVGNSLQGQLPLALARLSSMFDVVVVNAGSVWDEHAIELIEASTHSVCLVDQRVSSVRLSQKILSLCTRCGVAGASVAFALTRVGKESLFTPFDVSCALKGRRVYELAEGGRAVEELLGVGKPAALIEEKNPFAVSIELMLNDLFPDLAEKGTGGGLEKRKGRKRLLFGRKAQVSTRARNGVEGGGDEHSAS